MPVYTRQGDKGKTSLLGGVKVGKSNPIIDALGSIDELNAHIGLCTSLLKNGAPLGRTSHTTPLGRGRYWDQKMADILKQLIAIQECLFSLAANLAAPSRKVLLQHAQKTGFAAPIIPNRPKQQDIDNLEKEIDNYDREIQPLKSFILPGGNQIAAELHIARSVCRRAERRCVSLKAKPIQLKYLNRLSDYLFTVARVVNARSKTPETIWKHQ